MKKNGTLFLIPTPLAFKGGNLADSLLPENLNKIKDLQYFVAESAKTARAHLKGLTRAALQELKIEELNEHTPNEKIAELLKPLLKGENVGLVSESGCPAVADPGAALINLCHQKGIRVEPWVGGSSILLALMASGLNGQRFRFLGYLPADSADRAAAIKKIEKESRKNNETQIFIETPYRNNALLSALVENCAPKTQICVACDLTLPTECIQTKSAKAWQTSGFSNDLKNQMAVFLLLG